MKTAFELRQEYIFPGFEPEQEVERKTGFAPRCLHVYYRRQCGYAAGGSGYCGRHVLHVHLTTQEAATILGVSPRTVIAKLGEPAAIDEYKYKKFQYFWAVERVVSAIGQIEQPKKRKPKDYAAIFAKRYAAPADAVSTACNALFNLNRYAKHARCQESNKTEIYALKDAFLRFLVGAGFLDSAWQHELVLPEKECWSCEGSGIWTDWDYGDQEECHKCNGTGIYLPEKRIQFVCLVFTVAGQRYTWHQPAEQITYPVQLSIAPAGDDWTPEAEKPLEMDRRKFAEAKALIRWIVDNAEAVS